MNQVPGQSDGLLEYRNTAHEGSTSVEYFLYSNFVNKDIPVFRYPLTHSPTHPVVWMTVGASRMIGQPLFSISLSPKPFVRLHPTLILSILIYYFPHLFFCLPFLLHSSTDPCRIIFASPVDLVMCPYPLNLCFLTVVIRSSYDPIDITHTKILHLVNFNFSNIITGLQALNW